MTGTTSTGGGLSRRGDAVETEVPGDPAAFHALASYLRDSIGGKVEDLGDEVASHRSHLLGSWRGVAGEAFAQRAGTLASTCDLVFPQVLAGANELDALGETLHAVQDDLVGVRATAAASGCPVSGTLILKPVHERPLADIVANPFARTPAQAATDAAFVQAVTDADALWQTWYDRINDAGGFIANHAAELIGYLSDLTTAAAVGGLKVTAASVLTKQAAWLRGQEVRLKDHATHLATYLAKTGDESVVYGLVDDSVTSRYAARAAETAAKDPPLPVGVRGGLGTLGAVATGAGIYADVHEGESGAQAVVSQGGGLVAGVIGGVALGGVAGSVAPGPGTIAGAVIVGGAELVGGTVAAVLGDKVIDSLWPGGDNEDEPEQSEADLTKERGEALLEQASQVIEPGDQ